MTHKILYYCPVCDETWDRESVPRTLSGNRHCHRRLGLPPALSVTTSPSEPVVVEEIHAEIMRLAVPYEELRYFTRREPDEFRKFVRWHYSKHVERIVGDARKAEASATAEAGDARLRAASATNRAMRAERIARNAVAKMVLSGLVGATAAFAVASWWLIG